MSKKASVNPTIGETTIGMTTFSMITSQWTVVAEARPAPVSPPIRACDDDDGRPFHHVMRFHVIAPMSPAKTTTMPATPSGGVMMPLPMVVATLVPRSAPTRFMTAAMIRAARGVRARVETDVAMALAASWKPLV